jgi:hypothetical protein
MDDLLQKKAQGPLSTQNKCILRDLHKKMMHRKRMRNYRSKIEEATAVPEAAPTKQDTEGA